MQVPLRRAVTDLKRLASLGSLTSCSLSGRSFATGSELGQQARITPRWYKDVTVIPSGEEVRVKQI